MSATGNGHIIVAGVRKDKKDIIRVLNDVTGNIVEDIPTMCPDGSLLHCFYLGITVHPSDANLIIETCIRCQQIRSYNLSNGEGNLVLYGCKPRTMCAGPEQGILVLDEQKQLLQLKWDKNSKILQQVYKVQTGVRSGTDADCSMCYVNEYDICVFTSYQYGSV